MRVFKNGLLAISTSQCNRELYLTRTYISLVNYKTGDFSRGGKTMQTVSICHFPMQNWVKPTIYSYNILHKKSNYLYSAIQQSLLQSLRHST